MKWDFETIWRKSLLLQLGNLRRLRANEAGARQIDEASRRIERIWAEGSPEWQAGGLPSGLP